MMHRVVIVLVFLQMSLWGSASFGASLIKEYEVKAMRELGKERFAKEKKVASANRAFLAAKKKEKEQIGNMGKGRPDLTFYEDVVPLLCRASKESGSALPGYIALEISQHLWLMKNEKLNKACLAETAKQLSQKRYCQGYLYYGVILGQKGEHQKAIEVLSEGSKNCKSPYMLQQIAKKRLLYKYKTNKGNK